MKIKILKKNLLWVSLYGLALIVGSQVLAFYLYKNLNESVYKFIETGINNDKILAITEKQYPPGKGTYKLLNLSSNNTFPVFIENQEKFEDSIKVNQFIFKEANTKYFKVIHDGGDIKYEPLFHNRSL